MIFLWKIPCDGRSTRPLRITLQREVLAIRLV
jgi:hypothetical protein